MLSGFKGHRYKMIKTRVSRMLNYKFALFAVSSLAAVLVASTAGAGPYPKIYAFGDSLSDAGNIYAATKQAEPVSPPYSAGRFSNGPVWVQDLSTTVGLGALKASLLGGTDYAVGGATTGKTSVQTANETDLPSQLASFKSTVPKPNPAALFTVWIGANDLLAILGADLKAAATTTAVNQVVANEQTFLTGLAKLGAKHVVVLTVPDLGVTPEVTASGAAASKAATALTKKFNAVLTAKLKTIATTYKLDLTMVDTVALLDNAVAKPAADGFTNVKAPCWTGDLTSKTSGKVCAPTAAGQNKYLFWDELHPTAAGHTLISKAVEKALDISAPAEVAFR
jgi:phospholipase/lecithinase/hemolysin